MIANTEHAMPIIEEPSVAGRCIVTSDGPPGRLAILEAYLIILGHPPIIPAHIRERIEREERECREAGLSRKEA